MRITDYLGYGRENARSARSLSDELGIRRRKVTLAIEAARLRGWPICASSNGENGGFYLASCSAELAEYEAQRRYRAKAVARVTDALQVTLDNWNGQLTLWEKKQTPATLESVTGASLRTKDGCNYTQTTLFGQGGDCDG